MSDQTAPDQQVVAPLVCVRLVAHEGDDIMVWAAFNQDMMRAQTEVINASSHRVIAILAASLVDEALLRILEFRLKQGETQKNMFKPSGIMGDFTNKAALAYLLYAVSKDVYTAILGISEVRNVFAHKLAISSFDEEDEKLTLGFKKLKLHHNRKYYPAAFWDGDDRHEIGDVTARKDTFIANLQIILILLLRDVYTHSAYSNIPIPLANGPATDHGGPLASQDKSP